MSERAKSRPAARGLAFLTLAVGAWTGCSQTEPSRTESRLPDRVEIRLVDREEFDAVLARLTGRVVLVDCWATWCGPCVEQLPHAVELPGQHPNTDLAVVTLNFDDPDAAGQVRSALERVGASGLTNLQSRFGGSSQSMEVFEIASGTLPHYKLFDRQGKLHRMFELDPSAKTQFTPADVDAAVAELLAK
jgi:thiol-disulfide isomerase/thioredoxin